MADQTTSFNLMNYFFSRDIMTQFIKLKLIDA